RMPASAWNRLDRHRVSLHRDVGDPPKITSNDRHEPRPMGLQTFDKAGGSGASGPKVERQGRREIGRALEAFYDDVVRQGVPPRILALLDDLNARTSGRADRP